MIFPYTLRPFVVAQALAFTLWKKSQFKDSIKLFHEIEDSNSIFDCWIGCAREHIRPLVAFVWNLESR